MVFIFARLLAIVLSAVLFDSSPERAVAKDGIVSSWPRCGNFLINRFVMTVSPLLTGTGRGCAACSGIRVLVDLNQLLQAVYLDQLIDIGIWIGIRSRVLVLQLGHQKREKVVRRDHGTALAVAAVRAVGCIAVRCRGHWNTSRNLHLISFRARLNGLPSSSYADQRHYVRGVIRLLCIRYGQGSRSSGSSSISIARICGMRLPLRAISRSHADRHLPNWTECSRA